MVMIARKNDDAEGIRALLAAIVEFSNDAIIAKDLAGTITSWNPAAEHMYGYQAEEIIGRNISDLVPKEYRDEFDEILAKVARGERVEHHETERVLKDGSRIAVSVTVSPIRDSAGKLVGASSIARDITEDKRRRSEESVRAASLYARSLIEASLDPLVTISSDGKITDVNEATVQATGFARATLIGTDFAGYFTEPEKARAGYRQVFEKGFVTDYPLALRHVSGRVKDVLYNASLYRDSEGRVTGVFAAARDITERKRAQEQLARHREYLEELVAARTADLAKANVLLETTNKELEAFSYSVSHDLRTPLRAIDGFSQILLEDYTEKLDAEGKRVLNVVRENTKKMSQLIDDILAFSRAGRQEMAIGEVHTERVVREAIEELKPASAGRNIAFLIKSLPTLSGDPAMLRRVFVNLLDNAIKFTAPKPRAVIEVVARREGNEVVLSVKDNGVGFDMQYVGKLFGVFQRLHGPADFPGTGIGLAIVKRIVNRHGGRVWAEGKPGEGAVFYFTIPIREKSDA